MARVRSGTRVKIREGVKASLQRYRFEVVVPARREPASLRDVRLRRFRLPEAVEVTRDTAGEGTFLVDVDRMLNRARFRYGSRGWHPLVEALREQLARPGLDYEQTLLARFYERFQPATVHDALLGEEVPRREVARWPAIDPLLDVWSATHRNVARYVDRFGRGEKRFPSQYFGPNTVTHGRDHIERTLLIHRSVQDTGYRPHDFHDGVLSGYFLIDGDDYRVVVGRGNHRLAALTVLGIRRVPVRLRGPHPPVVSRDELPRWTIPRGGLFSPQEAVALFDSYFSDDDLERARALGLA